MVSQASNLLHLALGLHQGSPMAVLLPVRLLDPQRRPGRGRLLLYASSREHEGDDALHRPQLISALCPMVTTACTLAKISQ